MLHYYILELLHGGIRTDVSLVGKNLINICELGYTNSQILILMSVDWCPRDTRMITEDYPCRWMEMNEPSLGLRQKQRHRLRPKQSHRLRPKQRHKRRMWFHIDWSLCCPNTDWNSEEYIHHYLSCHTI